jgi:hypothetical protein
LDLDLRIGVDVVLRVDNAGVGPRCDLKKVEAGYELVVG